MKPYGFPKPSEKKVYPLRKNKKQGKWYGFEFNSFRRRFKKAVRQRTKLQMKMEIELIRNIEFSLRISNVDYETMGASLAYYDFPNVFEEEFYEYNGNCILKFFCPHNVYNNDMVEKLKLHLIENVGKVSLLGN